MIPIRRTLNFLNDNRFLWPAKIAMTGLVIYLVDKSLPKNHIVPLLKQMSIWPVTLAVLLGCGSFYFQVARWRIILRCAGIPVGRAAAWRTMLWGCLLAFITPGRTGEFFRGTGLPASKKGQTVYAVLVDKMFAGGATAVIGALCCGAFLGCNRPLPWGSWVIALGAALAVAGAAVVFGLGKHGRLKAIGDHLPKMAGRSLGLALACSIAAQLLLLVQTAVLFAMFGRGFSGATIVAAGQAYAFMLFFPFFIANMGIREYAFGMFLAAPFSAQTSTTPAVAFGASMGILAINLIAPALAGLAWWLVDKKR